VARLNFSGNEDLFVNQKYEISVRQQGDKGRVRDSVILMTDMIERLTSGIKMEFEVKRMEPLFASQADYDAFQTRHAQHQVKKGDLSTYSGNCYLGIDAGSTTTKVALVGEDGSLLYSFYDNNNGSTIATAMTASVCGDR
jgi:activator of 2-hydroxyglutaryl-CoA dehydratase